MKRIASIAALVAALGVAAQAQNQAPAKKSADAPRHEHKHDGHEHGKMEPTTKAVATLVAVGDSGVSGKLMIERKGKGVMIAGTVEGLAPNSTHGFHIHEFGDLSDMEKGMSVGDHFAPDGAEHGKPTDKPSERHVGDLGNIKANAQGVAEIRIEDEMVTLHGPNSVVGRAFVVHADEDKFTQPSGDAGGRIAFGTIGVAKGEKRTEE